MYRTCPYCGSNLDPGETCDCKKEPEAVTPKRIVTREDWERARDFIKAANPGDLVVEEIVDEMRDSVPPASMKAGYLQAGEDTKTEIAGVFAAGDVRAKSLRQVATAVSDGAVAAEQAREYLMR